MNAAGEVRSAPSPRGRAAIGRYVKVKFEGGKWYRARVDNYSSSRRKRYHITYDDGDDEWVTFTDADVQLVSEAYCHPSAAHRHEKSDVKKASRKRSRSSASSRHRRESKDRSNANNSSTKSNAASDKSNTQTKIKKEQPVKRSRRAVESADRSSASKVKKTKKVQLSRRAAARERKRRIFCERQVQLYLAIQKANEGTKKTESTTEDSSSGSESEPASSTTEAGTARKAKTGADRPKAKTVAGSHWTCHSGTLLFMLALGVC